MADLVTRWKGTLADREYSPTVAHKVDLALFAVVKLWSSGKLRR